MSDAGEGEVPGYHLLLEAEEIPVAGQALRLLISDEAHEPQIRGIARSVIDELGAPADAEGRLTIELDAPQMKITHGACRLLLNDLQREQAPERECLHAILAKLPDEHTMRAITLD
jgi:hypothetical protein